MCYSTDCILLWRSIQERLKVGTYHGAVFTRLKSTSITVGLGACYFFFAHALAKTGARPKILLQSGIHEKYIFKE